MNDTIKDISNIICEYNILCERCGTMLFRGDVSEEATTIYTTHVKPLKDALAKAEEREKVLVEALEAAKSTLDLINNKMPGGVYYKKYEPVAVAVISKAGAALATVKGEVC